jgi:hypothetical protein
MEVRQLAVRVGARERACLPTCLLALLPASCEYPRLRQQSKPIHQPDLEPMRSPTSSPLMASHGRGGLNILSPSRLVRASRIDPNRRPISPALHRRPCLLGVQISIHHHHCRIALSWHRNRALPHLLPPAKPVLQPRNPALGVADEKGDDNEREGDAEGDAKHPFGHVAQMDAVGAAAVNGIVGEFEDVDGKDAGHEGHGKEDNGDDGEDHDGLALLCRVLRLISCEARLLGSDLTIARENLHATYLKCVRVFLLQVENLREADVDCFGGLVHPLDVKQMKVNECFLLSQLPQ